MRHQPLPPDDLPSMRVLAGLSVIACVLAVCIAVAVVIPAETGRDPSGLGRVLGLSEMGRIKVALAKEAAADVGGARVVRASPRAGASRWRDSMTVTLQPNQGIELKMTMRASEKAFFEWTTEGGEVYFNMHGEPSKVTKDDAAHRYGKGTSTAESGELVAAFDGVHGWFWRNRTDRTVKITLKTGGEYLVLKEMK